MGEPRWPPSSVNVRNAGIAGTGRPARACHGSAAFRIGAENMQSLCEAMNWRALLSWRRTTQHDPSRASSEGRSSGGAGDYRSEEHTSELQSLMRLSDAVFCLK